MHIAEISVIIILIIMLLILLIKIFLMKKSLKEISSYFSKIIKQDTNALLTISSQDKQVRELAESLNAELRELRKEKLQYENGSYSLKQSITNISHDMRTPLTAISGYIDLLEEHLAKDERTPKKLTENNENNETHIDTKETEKYIKIIKRKTNDLIMLTEQLFDFSKTMDLSEKVHKEKCAINELLEEALANYYVIFIEKNISPQVKLCKEKIYRKVDRNAIIRVFENILSNVSKYSNGDLYVELNKEGKIIFSNKANLLDVSTVQKIFDRYFTVENAKKSTGIGLSIAKQLVELNGGVINAKYENGKLIVEISL